MLVAVEGDHPIFRHGDTYWRNNQLALMIDWLSSGVSAKNWTHGRFILQLEDL
jgi:hypothetical protein